MFPLYVVHAVLPLFKLVNIPIINFSQDWKLKTVMHTVHYVVCLSSYTHKYETYTTFDWVLHSEM